MPDQLLQRISFVEKGLHYEVAGTKQALSGLVLGLLSAQLWDVVGVFVIRRQSDSQPLAFLSHDFHGESRVRIGAFQYGRYPQPRGGPQRLERTGRPGVDDIDLSRQFFNSARHDVVVNGNCTHRTDDFVRQPELSLLQSRRDSHVRPHGPADGRWKYQYVGSGNRQSIHLLPGDTADPIGP